MIVTAWIRFINLSHAVFVLKILLMYFMVMQDFDLKNVKNSKHRCVLCKYCFANTKVRCICDVCETHVAGTCTSVTNTLGTHRIYNYIAKFINNS